MSRRHVLVRQATLPDGNRTDILIENGRIARCGTIGSRSGAIIVDADGLRVLPGLVDLHTHLREPGFERSETVLTGTRAAAAGGYTAVFAMANTSPVADTASVVEHVSALGREAGYATVRPIGAVSVGLAGERLAEIGAMASSHAKVRVFSDDGQCVWDPQLMRRALEYVKAFDGVIAQHAQEPRLTVDAQMNEGAVSSELGLGGWPSLAEEAIIERDVLMAQYLGSRLHICHVSTAGSVDIIRWAKKRGIAVTAEVTPHHLVLTENLVRGYDSRFKVNPPLRTHDDVQALRGALADRTIDIIATDHAPHPAEAKECEWAAAAFGMIGLESALSVVHGAVVADGLLDWIDVARVMSSEPARIGHLAGYDEPFSVGAHANLTLYDPHVERVFDGGSLVGLSTNSPYIGHTLPGQVQATIHNGYLTVDGGKPVAADDVARAAKEDTSA